MFQKRGAFIAPLPIDKIKTLITRKFAAPFGGDYKFFLEFLPIFA
jgi:hypothetical protein